MQFSAAFVLSIVLASSSAVNAVPTWDWSPQIGLHQLARLSGRYVGTASDKWILDGDEPYAKIAASNEFGQVTHENTVKWEKIEPQPGVFNFTEADALMDWAKKHNKQVRGHTLVWHSQLAPWVTANNYTAPALKKVLENHVTTVAKHFKGKIFQWDVVNEVFNDDGTYRDTVFYRAFGEDYIKWAFQWARKADPKAKLYINDYNFESDSPKTQACTALVRKLKSQGVPIDGIGAQGHLTLGNLSPTMLKVWKTWSDDLKVDVAVTELDIRMLLPETPEKLAQQAADYKTVTDNCMKVKRCKGITLWQYTDKYSWVPGWFEGEGSPLPWNEELEKKPAYNAMAKSLLKFW